MPDCRYELRRGDEVIAAGYFSREQPLEVGERITIGGRAEIFRRLVRKLARVVVATGAAV